MSKSTGKTSATANQVTKSLMLDIGEVSLTANEICQSETAARLLMDNYNQLKGDYAGLQGENRFLQQNLNTHSKFPLITLICAGINVMLTIVISILVNIYTSAMLGKGPVNTLWNVIVCVGIAIILSNILPSIFLLLPTKWFIKKY